MESFVHRGLRLEYEDRGQGLPLVFLHGMGGSVEQIRGVWDPLPGVRLIAPNQQGHGGSEVCWDRYDFSALAEDVEALLDRLGLERVCMAGISMGAAVAVNFAARFPGRVRGLMLIRNAWTDQPMAPEVRTAYRDLALCLESGSLEDFRRTEGWSIVERTSEYTRHTFTVPFSDPVARKHWRKYLILPEKAPIVSPDWLERLTMPVHILANRNDFCHPFAYGVYFRDRIPGARFREIPDKDADAAGHRAAVNDALRGMLEGFLCP